DAVVAVAPEPGRRVDRAVARARIPPALEVLPHPRVEVGLETVAPTVSAEAVNAAAARVRNLLAAPVEVTAAAARAFLDPAEIGRVIRVDPGPDGLVVGVDPDGLQRLLSVRLP